MLPCWDWSMQIGNKHVLLTDWRWSDYTRGSTESWRAQWFTVSQLRARLSSGAHNQTATKGLAQLHLLLLIFIRHLLHLHEQEIWKASIQAFYLKKKKKKEFIQGTTFFRINNRKPFFTYSSDKSTDHCDKVIIMLLPNCCFHSHLPRHMYICIYIANKYPSQFLVCWQPLCWHTTHNAVKSAHPMCCSLFVCHMWLNWFTCFLYL